MNKEFIPYEEALALKELRFGEGCFKSYLTDTKELTSRGFADFYKDHEVVAPLYQQAFRWFRDILRVKHSIWMGKMSDVYYGYDIIDIGSQKLIIDNSGQGGGDCDYATYEEAELACLKKLIELTKIK